MLLLALAAQFAHRPGRLDGARVLRRRIAPAELLPGARARLPDRRLPRPDRLPRRARHRGRPRYAYLLAIAPGALLGLIARERSGRIAHELALERAFRRSTRALDARADDLHRHAGRLARGESAPEDRARLERILLATTVEALQADAGRLSEIGDDGALHVRLAIGDQPPELDAAELDLGAIRRNALAIGVGHSHVLAIVRPQRPFDAVERDLLEHLAAQAAVSLENLRLEELAGTARSSSGSARRSTRASPTRSSSRCSRPSCRRSPASRPARSTAPRRATRSAATSTTSSAPATASGSR